MRHNKNVSAQTETDIFESLNLDLNLICDYPKCETKATHFLVCPLCRASENMCDPHTVLAHMADPDEFVVFDKSCGHRVLMNECGKVPIG